MPSVKVFCEDIELRSTWKATIKRLELDGEVLEMPQLERRVVGGPYRGKKVVVGMLPGDYFKSGTDYEAALARLLADVEACFADLLESGDSEADDRDANAAA